MEKFKYNLKDPPTEGQAELWKISRLGFILNQIMQKYPEFSINSLLLVLFLSHFKHSCAEFMVYNNVTGNHNIAYVRIALNKLVKYNFVDKINLATDSQLALMYPENVYQLTAKGRSLANSIHLHMDGTNDFLNFNLQ